MTKKQVIFLICLIIGLLVITPVSAKEITSKVDDKKIIHDHDGFYFIHTVDFGDIEVMEREYQKVFIGDNITFNTESEWGFYTILKINGELI